MCTLESNSDGSSWVPATHVGNPDRTLGAALLAWPGIVGVNQWTENLKELQVAISDLSLIFTLFPFLLGGGEGAEVLIYGNNILFCKKEILS